MKFIFLPLIVENVVTICVYCIKNYLREKATFDILFFKLFKIRVHYFVYF